MYPVQGLGLTKLHMGLIGLNQVWIVAYIGLILYYFNLGNENPI